MDYLESSLNFMLPTDLNLYYCGKRNKTLNHEYGPTVRSHFLIIYVKEGSGVILSESPNLELNAGDVFFMFPNHKIHYKVNPNTAWTILWIGVYGKLVDKYVELLGVSADNPIFKPSNPDKIEDTLNRIYEASLNDNISNKIKCLSLTQRFFSYLFENFSEKSPSDVRLSEAVYFMKLNYDRGISAKDVAEKLNIDQSYFTRSFAKAFGKPPNRWLNDFRIEKACELLSETDLPVNNISYSVGIFDPLYFSRLFKKLKGISPSQYRNERQPK